MLFSNLTIICHFTAEYIYIFIGKVSDEQVVINNVHQSVLSIVQKYSMDWSFV